MTALVESDPYHHLTHLSTRVSARQRRRYAMKAGRQSVHAPAYASAVAVTSDSSPVLGRVTCTTMAGSLAAPALPPEPSAATGLGDIVWVVGETSGVVGGIGIAGGTSYEGAACVGDEVDRVVGANVVDRRSTSQPSLLTPPT